MQPETTTSDDLSIWVNESLQQHVKDGKSEITTSTVEQHVKSKLQERNEISSHPSNFHAEISNTYKSAIREILWELAVQGILIPGSASFSPLTITKWGKKCIVSGEYLPQDAAQYINRLKAALPDLDDAISLYLKEGLGAFRARLYFASAVMAGVAAERTLLLLRDAVELALPEDKRTAFRSKTEGRAIKRVFDEIWNRLNPVHDKLASDLHKEDVRAELSGAFDLIRKTRNDAGHPTKRDITREEAHGVLLLFPGFCQIAYRTIGWLRSNPF